MLAEQDGPGAAELRRELDALREDTVSTSRARPPAREEAQPLDRRDRRAHAAVERRLDQQDEERKMPSTESTATPSACSTASSRRSERSPTDSTAGR